MLKIREKLQQQISIEIAGRSLSCVIKYKPVKYIYFRMSHEMVLTVTLPKRYSSQIDSIVQSRSSWIIRQISKVDQSKKIVSHDQIYFLGKIYPFETKLISKGKQNCMFADGKLIFYLTDIQNLQNRMDDFLKKETSGFMNVVIPNWVQTVGLCPKEFAYRKMKKWGCCTSKGKIVFNSYLICLPKELIEYIICHELVHLKYFNHSRFFHKAVSAFLPDAKRLEKDLKLYCK